MQETAIQKNTFDFIHSILSKVFIIWTLKLRCDRALNSGWNRKTDGATVCFVQTVSLSSRDDRPAGFSLQTKVARSLLKEKMQQL